MLGAANFHPHCPLKNKKYGRNGQPGESYDAELSWVVGTWACQKAERVTSSEA